MLMMKLDFDDVHKLSDQLLCLFPALFILLVSLLFHHLLCLLLSLSLTLLLLILSVIAVN